MAASARPRDFPPLARYSWSAGWQGRRRVHEPHAILKRVVRGRVDPDHGHGRVHHVLQRVIIPTGTLKVNEPHALDGATEPLLATSGLHAPYCGHPVLCRISFQGLAQYSIDVPASQLLSTSIPVTMTKSPCVKVSYSSWGTPVRSTRTLQRASGT